MTAIDLDKLDLAALLCSRICHDVIGPVGAVVNGMEMLEDSDDPSQRAFALDHIAKSAREASARLQFARLAFGAAGSAGADIDLGDAAQVARGFIEDDRTKLDWRVPRTLQPKNRVKLLLNLLVAAAGTVPRGGTVSVEALGEAGYRIVTTGPKVLVPRHLSLLLEGGAPEGGVIDAHAIQPHYAGLLARAAGMAVSVDADFGSVRIEAVPG
ncbi:MAG TPA: histidine phosphotransferase family protein [Xanthobacteraceae bacterium]|nr:histidine phosphotransferase family protein [Xanthobacteraceae bacterium]